MSSLSLPAAETTRQPADWAAETAEFKKELEPQLQLMMLAPLAAA